MLTIPSLGKLLVLALVLLAVWYGFRLMGRAERIRREEAKLRQAGKSGRPAKAARRDIEDTVKCAVCGAYIAASGAASCGRADCPV